jgi:hypothetical protein
MSQYDRTDDTAEWLNYLQPEGLVVGANVLRERGLTPIRQTPLDTQETAQALRLDPEMSLEDQRRFALGDAWSFLETVLQWPAKFVAGAPNGPGLPSELTITVPEHDTLLTPDMALLWNGDAEDDLPAQALVMFHPTLDPDARGLFTGEWEATPHQRLERLLRETRVGIGILIGQNTLRLIYAPRGETAGWLSWPLAALGRVEGRPMLAGLKLCMGRNAFFTGAKETRLRALLKASREAQNEVSEKLSGQVLGALHELLRALHRADPDRIETLAKNDSQHLYEGLLACLMRLVFLLYAEDRDLLPSTSEPKLRQLWESGYSIKTLYARLLADEALNPDTMDERRGAWGQLLAVFRLIHGGYPDWVARRGGKLFDPDEFPFLEGRDKGSRRDDAEVMPVSDGAILRILHGLMTVEARTLSGAKIRERLSYRTLDVESIGSVYETVMGFTAARATQRMIALRDEKKLPTFIELESLLAQKPADRQKWLKELSIKLTGKQATGVKEAASIPALIEAFGSLVDLRASPNASPIGAGVPYLQPTEERRRSGSHYTPRSLTEPIVRHALEPAFERLGHNASPEAVLSLKVCDPACGSGAFLVEACRQLGARLEQAWNMHGAEKPAIPPDEDEALHARRLVAQRCLYGVDRNPMAVDLARLSLWLATLARDHEFTFLDHAIKSGDSLVGLTRRQIEAANWNAEANTLPLYGQMIRQTVERALQGREAIRTAPDDVTRAIQEARHKRVESEVDPARIVGDAVVAAFFAGDKPKTREIERVTIEQLIVGQPQPRWDELKARASTFRAEQGWRPFHWEIEFPEVFGRDNPGFDAIVGNPPFLGGTNISERLGMSYFAFLTNKFSGAGHHCDLVAYFFRRAFELLRSAGAFGFIATNTISQGDTRRGGLEHILSSGGEVFRVTKRLVWPGDAAVVVKTVHVAKDAQLPSRIDTVPVERISAFLIAGQVDTSPWQISQEVYVSLGCKPYGQGFIFDDSDPETNSIADMERIRRSSPAELEFVHPYIAGEDINRNPTHQSGRFIMQASFLANEGDLARIPLLHELILQKVRPERLRLGSNPNNLPLKKRYWAYQAHRPQLTAKLKSISRAVCISRVSPHLAFALVDSKAIFSEAIVVCASQSTSFFSTLQSRVHEIWARFFSSSMKDDLRYAPSDCFETFPFPPGYGTDPALEEAGQTYHDHRAQLMIAADEGMTKTYNRFHKPSERGPAIQRLRELHDEMDRAVLRAYGWHDLADELKPEFLTEETEDDHTYQGRYFWNAEGRDRVLSRLLALNAERHAEELAAGKVTTGRRAASAEDDDAADDDSSEDGQAGSLL